MYLYQANFLAMGIEIVNDLFHGVAERAHADNHTVRIICAVVVKEMVIRANFLVDLLHVAFDNIRQRYVSAIDCLAVLEVDVPVLMRAAGTRMLRV